MQPLGGGDPRDPQRTPLQVDSFTRCTPSLGHFDVRSHSMYCVTLMPVLNVVQLYFLELQRPETMSVLLYSVYAVHVWG